jgi:hypothetical protein
MVFHPFQDDLTFVTRLYCNTADLGKHLITVTEYHDNRLVCTYPQEHCPLAAPRSATPPCIGFQQSRVNDYGVFALCLEMLSIDVEQISRCRVLCFNTVARRFQELDYTLADECVEEESNPSRFVRHQVLSVWNDMMIGFMARKTRKDIPPWPSPMNLATQYVTTDDGIRWWHDFQTRLFELKRCYVSAVFCDDDFVLIATTNGLRVWALTPIVQLPGYTREWDDLKQTYPYDRSKKPSCRLVRYSRHPYHMDIFHSDHRQSWSQSMDRHDVSSSEGEDYSFWP